MASSGLNWEKNIGDQVRLNVADKPRLSSQGSDIAHQLLQDGERIATFAAVRRGVDFEALIELHTLEEARDLRQETKGLANEDAKGMRWRGG